MGPAERFMRWRMTTTTLLGLVLATGCGGGAPAAPQDPGVRNARLPRDDQDLRAWLTNMVAYHRFTPEEVRAATGLPVDAIRTALERLDIRPGVRPTRESGDPLTVLPYPGGRHPRIGFLEGAVDPQRETKISVFTPWNERDYVVVDVPEAIWTGKTRADRELMYLAHSHIDTHWTKRGVTLDPLEWSRRDNGSLTMRRTLPNGIAFGTEIVPTASAIRMHLWLFNGTSRPLTGLRVQNCVMLKAADGFNAQAKAETVFQGPYAAMPSTDGKRWIITAWEPHERNWANSRCPCLHSDPRFPDCAPGQLRRLRGWLSFYEGADVRLQRRASIASFGRG